MTSSSTVCCWCIAGCPAGGRAPGAAAGVLAYLVQRPLEALVHRALGGGGRSCRAAGCPWAATPGEVLDGAKPHLRGDCRAGGRAALR